MTPVLALPVVVDRLLGALAAADEDGFVGLFARSAVVDDWGVRHLGREAIRRWGAREWIGGRGRLVPKQVHPRDNGVMLIADWLGDYYNGCIRILFAIEGEHILEMRITNA